MNAVTNTNSSIASQEHFSSISQRNAIIRKFANQDYDEIKKGFESTKSWGLIKKRYNQGLFEDPEFGPSNKLLVDKNHKHIISYFGKTKFDGKPIEWLRPHVSVINTENVP